MNNNKFKSNLKSISLLLIIFLILIYACSNNPVTTNNNQPSNYTKVFSTSTDQNRFEIFSATNYNLTKDYNDIGFKVYQNNQEMKSGFVKFNPHMWHSNPAQGTHSSPVSPKYNYDNSKQLFTGYICFTMPSDSGSHWYGFFNYNDLMHIDSIPMQVSSNSFGQMRSVVDTATGSFFIITLAAPMSPKQGANEFKCLLHQCWDNFVNFTEIDSARMSIFPWMHLMGHGSSNNQNPVSSGNGMYSGGSINLNMSGEWYVYDTITYQNRVIFNPSTSYFSIQSP